MKRLKNQVAVVAGASRGAGRGIARALGEAGATVYVLGRTTRCGPKPADGAPGTIEQTAEEVSQRGGQGIPVRTDCTSDEEVAAAFQRISSEQGKLDICACAVWGAADGAGSPEAMMESWGKPFWRVPTSQWRAMMDGGPRAYYLVAWHAAQLMAKRRKGLIAGLTDFIAAVGDEEPKAGSATEGYAGQLLWDLSHHCINRLLYAMSVELKPDRVAVITLMPGFMQTERVLKTITSEALKKQFRFDLSESTEYVGRAVAALAGDRGVLKKSGKIHFVADLAREYGFTDVDGRVIPRFQPFGA
jgi:NAD(P)-dependent dehydrogenase (short-subunit alcohol dehydrogenase family)